MAVSLLKHSCPCPRNRILRACIQNLLQNKTETFKNNHAEGCFSFFFFWYAFVRLQLGSRGGLETREKQNSCEIFRQILQTHTGSVGWKNFKIIVWYSKLWCFWTFWYSFGVRSMSQHPHHNPQVMLYFSSGTAVELCWKSRVQWSQIRKQRDYGCVHPLLNLMVHFFHFRENIPRFATTFLLWKHRDLRSDLQNFGLPPLWD